jgi:hypothetical protein
MFTSIGVFLFFCLRFNLLFRRVVFHFLIFVDVLVNIVILVAVIRLEVRVIVIVFVFLGGRQIVLVRFSLGLLLLVRFCLDRSCTATRLLRRRR